MEGGVRNTRPDPAQGGNTRGVGRPEFRRCASCNPSHALRAEMRVQCTLIGPVAGTVLLQVLVDMITLVMVGHLGATELAAAALGNFYCNSIGFAISGGMASAIDTLSSQAFGARNYGRIGVIAQRAVALLSLLGVFQAALWWRSDLILGHLGQDSAVVALSTSFIAARIPELWASATFEVVKRSLQAQGMVRPALVVACLTILWHSLVSYLLTYHTPWGFWGATAASISTRWIQAGGLVGYVLWRGRDITHVTVGHVVAMAAQEEGGGGEGEGGGYAPVSTATAVPSAVTPTTTVAPTLTREQVLALSRAELLALPPDTVLGVTWGGCSPTLALSRWWEFLVLGVPGAIVGTLDWASFEALAVIAGALGVEHLAAHTIVAQVGTLSFLVPYGIAIAVSVRVGQAMGRGDAPTAKLAARVGFAVGVMWSVLNFLLVVPSGTLWPRAFTQDPVVIALAARTAWGVALFSVGDSIQQIVVGTLRGIGRQGIGAIVYPVAYLGVGVPMAWVLAHPAGMGLIGVWLGESLGAALAVGSLSCVLLFWYDWTALAAEAKASAAEEVDEGTKAPLAGQEEAFAIGTASDSDEDGRFCAGVEVELPPILLEEV